MMCVSVADVYKDELRRVSVVVERSGRSYRSWSRREEGVRWNDVCKCRRYV
jgi:hypothetical protein